jgi:hypothetical protein
MKCSFALALLLAGALASSAQAPDHGRFEDSAEARWLRKPALASRTLDDMESKANWTAFTTGAPEVVDARTVQQRADRALSVTEMTLTREHSREGRPSLRMRLPSRLAGPGPKNGRSWGGAGVRRQIPGEDWQSSNRLSLWIYPDCPGWNVLALELRLHNDGAEKLPAPFGQEGETTVVVENGRWNHVVWEIGNVARDKVTRFSITSLMPGHEPGASDVLTYDLDHLELQRVEPDYIEGWGVWPGRVAFSHAGYQTGARKRAIASGLRAATFRLVDQATGKTAFSGPVQSMKTALGEFQALDFSAARQTGVYALEAGDVRNPPFRIDPDPWRETILKTLNFLYAERCGMAIPGVHDACHRDWTMVHGDQRIVVNGGWHDAGDLTQGLGNTAEIVYGLFSLAERLRARGEDPKLSRRLIDEGRWGLDWVLKTSFGDGYRNLGAISSRWTDGIIGTSDDLVVTAKNNPLGNFTAAAAEALAARVLKDEDPRLAAYSLKMAAEDWRFAREGMAGANAPVSTEQWRTSFDSDNVAHEIPAAGVLASVDLWQATREQRYAGAAVEMAGVILDSQERNRPRWAIPLFGFFYTGPDHQRILHYCHKGREQLPTLALTRLCEAFPDHPAWMKWYSAVALYADYLTTAATYNAPYGVLPASIYRDDEYQTVPESRRESFRKQVLNGVPLGEGHYLRRFPVWMDYRGHFGTILPQAQALLAAAHLRRDPDAAALAQNQAEWIVGRNPFGQSAMYGEGYDFAPLYSPFPGNIAGALPVGIQTRGASDIPYWPAQATWTYKEVWVHPAAEWIWLMRDLAGPALVEGQADAPVEFVPQAGQPARAQRALPAHGRFRINLPEGAYTIRSRRLEQRQTFLAAGDYRLDLRPGHFVDYSLAKAAPLGGNPVVRLTARGEGRHRFRLRTDNLSVSDAGKELDLSPSTPSAVEWQGRVTSPDSPWFAVVVVDDDPSQRRELTGAAWDR